MLQFDEGGWFNHSRDIPISDFGECQFDNRTWQWQGEEATTSPWQPQNDADSSEAEASEANDHVAEMMAWSRPRAVDSSSAVQL